MLWHSNNIWDIFPKGLLIGIGHYVGIAAHINETSTQNPWNLVTCKLYCKMAFILSKKERKKKKEPDLNVENQNKSIEIHLHIYGDLPAMQLQASAPSLLQKASLPEPFSFPHDTR